jgi:hypothetical protein
MIDRKMFLPHTVKQQVVYFTAEPDKNDGRTYSPPKARCMNKDRGEFQ